MEWRDQGTLLSTRRHGETSAIVEVFTAEHGRHAGVVRGATSRKLAPVLQPGTLLDVTWRARLDAHIGTFQVEPVRSRAPDLMADRLTLAGLGAATALLSFALPEREAHGALHVRTEALFDLIGVNPAWPLAYLRWELALLEDLGFGLDLSTCAVTGAMEDLTYVSPKSGRAVSAGAAGAWADRLLPLPPALLGEGDGNLEEIAQGLATTGYFLSARLAPAFGDRPVPDARQRFVDL
ncbi:MAG: DNA repair protein RecO, partial [Pseudomonadota bacterium]